MYKVINEYLGKVKLLSNENIYNRICSFLNDEVNIKSYSVTCNFNRYIVDVMLEDYSVDNTIDFFNNFNSTVSYSYSSFHIRFNEGSCVRYRYITSKENKEAFYCEIVLR